MTRSLPGYALCGAAVALVLGATLLLTPPGELPAAGVLAVLIVVGGTLPLAGAAWSATFRRG